MIEIANDMIEVQVLSSRSAASLERLMASWQTESCWLIRESETGATAAATASGREMGEISRCW